MSRSRTKHFTFVLFGWMILFSCKAEYLKVDPIPKDSMSVSKELEYIINTDQTDRKKGWLAYITQTRKGKLIYQRDSIRAQRVYQLYLMDSLKTDDDKFNAGVVLMHSSDSILRRACYNIFEDLELNGTTAGGRMNGKNWKKLVYR
jgi:hypothetical protein